MNYVILKNVKCKIMFTEAYLEPSRTSTMELFPLRFKPYFKSALNWIELLLGSIFLHNSSLFHEKTYKFENCRKGSLLLTIEKIFF